MTRLLHVKLTKITSLQTPEGALSNNHWLKGTLIPPYAVGERILVDRYERAGKTADEPATVQCQGVFESTPVVRIEGQYAITANSIWKVEELPGHAPMRIAVPVSALQSHTP